MIHWEENITSLLSQTKMHNLNWIIRKKNTHKLLRDILQNNWLVVFKKISVTRDKESLKSCSRLKETKGILQVNAFCNPELVSCLKKKNSEMEIFGIEVKFEYGLYIIE